MWRSVTDRLGRGRAWPAVTLGLLVAAVFGPAATFDFVRWDDLVNLTLNPLISEPWSLDLLIKLVNGDTALRFKPLTWLLHRATYSAFGFNPAAWHGVSLVLHLAAVIVLRVVLRAVLTRLSPGTAEETRDWLAWSGAALWAVHPAHVEPAVWVTATPYPLLVLFLLGSFWYYERATDPARASATRRNLGCAWLLALAGYATYPVGVTYGLWLMAADFFIFRSGPRTFRAWNEVGPWLVRHALFLFPAFISVLVTWKSSSTTPWLYPAPPTLEEVGVLVRLKMGAAMLGSVWTNFLWPFGQTPNNPMLPSWRTDGAFIYIMAFATLLGLLLVGLGWRRWFGVVGVVLGSTALALPVLGFGQWPHWAVADRHVYLPHVVLTGGLVVWLAVRWPTQAFLRPVLLVLVAGLALLGRNQVMIWRDTDTLFRYVVAQRAFTWNPGQQAYIYQLWAAHAQEQGRTEDTRSKNIQARHTLQQGALQAAEHAAWAEAVELSRLLEQAYGLPPQLRRERARWLLTLGRLIEAGHDLQRTQRELPDDAETRTLREEWQRRTGQAPTANHL